MAAGRDDEAADDLEKCALLDGNDADQAGVHYLLTRIMLEQQRFTEAVLHARAMVELQPENPVAPISTAWRSAVWANRT